MNSSCTGPLEHRPRRGARARSNQGIDLRRISPTGFSRRDDGIRWCTSVLMRSNSLLNFLFLGTHMQMIFPIAFQHRCLSLCPPRFDTKSDWTSYFSLLIFYRYFFGFFLPWEKIVLARNFERVWIPPPIKSSCVLFYPFYFQDLYTWSN